VQQHSNSYTLRYAIFFTTAVAIVLALLASGLRPMQERNIAQAKRAAILQSVMTVDKATLESDYNSYITEYVYGLDGSVKVDEAAFDVDIRKQVKLDDNERSFPVYVYNRDGEIRYIIPLEGKGLWGPITAFVALDSDLNTISGVVFEHEKETPGLGAEISMPMFEDRYQGKKLYNDGGELVSVRVLKGSGNRIDSEHEVDGLTGATMTLNGVNGMMTDELLLYENILTSINS